MAFTDSDRLLLSQAFDKILRSAGITENTFNFSSLAQSLSSTTGPMNIYVDPVLGNDKNNGFQTTPLATLQAAVDSLPKNIKHPVIINLAAGAYSGADICGFTLDRAVDTNLGQYLLVQGTFINATLASGLVTGTVASQTGGTAANATITVTGAGWTVNDLQDRVIEITGGTGVGTLHVIVSNTATVLTVAAFNTFVDGTSTFAIRDWGTIITNGTAAGPIPLPNIGLFGAVTPNIQTIMLSNNSNIAGVSKGFYFKNLKIVNNGSLGRGIRAFGADFEIDNCFITTTTSTPIQLVNKSTVALNSTIISCAGSSASTCLSSGTSLVADSANHIKINNSAIRNTNGSGIISGLCSGLIIENTYIKCGLAGINVQGTSGSAASAGNCRIDGGTTGVILNSQLGSTGFTLNATDISNCTTAINVSGPHSVFLTGIVTGGTNTTGISVSKGGSVQVSSGSTITGTTEVSVDGTSSTLAAMRAASPKVVSNPNYFTKIYE